ncbi:MAG: hypothetical protein K6T86_07885 [Pirellulales bacterium]|nr:hypothetical protein [Pirellulales bacterium]
MNRPRLDIDAIVREVADRVSALLAPQAADMSHASQTRIGQTPHNGHATRAAAIQLEPATPQGVDQSTAAVACPCRQGPSAVQPAPSNGASTACACRTKPAAPPACGCSQPLRHLVWNEQVITATGLAGRLDGVHELHVPQRAIVTPAANDLLRESGTRLVRLPPHIPQTLAAPLLVAVAETSWPTSSLISSLAAVGIGVEQLARSGLRQAADELAAHASKGGGKGLLLTARPYVGACLANRHAGVRAVPLEPSPHAQRAVQEAAANVLLLDPSAWPAFALYRLVRTFAAAVCSACPAELQETKG